MTQRGRAGPSAGACSQGLGVLAARPGHAKAAETRIRVCPKLDDALQDTTFVQESGPESIEAKRQIFSELDRIAP